ncbi:MAG: hypothetical protein M1834_001362 [Cirrosporium novae-zelandiae]|nr:MAG: hypothetical protein M1834_001362 [Cirrosporium novae-zelandiae]
MPHIFSIRELVQFPSGDNSTDVLINGVHFNRTALNYYNYTLYDNGTLSNRSHCYLTFGAYHPHMFSNGSFINATSCYSPYYGIEKRGGLGIAFACLFAASIMFTMIHLRKHGRKFLPDQKRFRPVGRRWQWYWMLFTAACGIISGITAVDVDRDYLQSLPLVLQSFFYYLMLPAILAAVWEGVRHWGSWRERQICDRDPFLLKQNDKRARIEFHMPLIFYLFNFLDFFMTIPRAWGQIEKQNSSNQALTVAKPTATDARFKAGAFLSICAYIVIICCLLKNLHYYSPPKYTHAPIARFFLYTPFKFLLVIPIVLIPIGYAVASSFDWTISPMRYNVDPAYMYGFGYAPIAAILIVFIVAGYDDPNEDRALIADRIERGRVADTELGITKKPSWWSKLHGDAHLSPEQRLRNLTMEVGGGPATGGNIERTLELNRMQKELDEAQSNQDPFRDHASYSDESRGRSDTRTEGTNNNSISRGLSQATTASTLVDAKPQVVRSMLDV